MAVVEDAEMEAEGLTREQVEARYDDWRHRVEELMADLTQWVCEAGGQVSPSTIPGKSEELLAEYDVSPTDMPKLDIRVGNVFAKVEPFGLWVIGGNGRVDVKTRRGVFKLVDIALPFTQAHWRVAGPGLRDAPPLSAALFLQVLRG